MSSSWNNDGLKYQDRLVEERWLEWGMRCSCYDYLIVGFPSPGLQGPKIDVWSDGEKESYSFLMLGLHCRPECE